MLSFDTPTYRLLSRSKPIRFLALAMLREAALSGDGHEEEEEFWVDVPGQTAARLFGPLKPETVIRHLRSLWWEQVGVCDADIYYPVFTQLAVGGWQVPHDSEWRPYAFALGPDLVEQRRREGTEEDVLTHWELDLFEGNEAAARAAFRAAHEELARSQEPFC